MYMALVWISRVSFWIVVALLVVFSSFARATDCRGYHTSQTAAFEACKSLAASVNGAAANACDSFNGTDQAGRSVIVYFPKYNPANGYFMDQCYIPSPAGSCPDGVSADTYGQCRYVPPQGCGGGMSANYGDPVISMRYAGNPSGLIGCQTRGTACASQKGGKVPSDSLQSSVLGCLTKCQVATSGPTKYLCEYTGGVADGSCTTINSEGDACGTDPAGLVNNPDTNVNPEPAGGCPAGTLLGTVNGKKYCAGSSNTNISSSGQTTGQNQNGTNTQVTSTTTTTATNPNGSITTTTISTTSGQVGTSGNVGVFKIDPNSTSDVSIKGAGSCDPTKSDYAQCIGMQGQGHCVDNPATPENECAGNGDGEGEGDGDCDPTSSDYIECVSPSNTLDHTDNGDESFQSVTDDFVSVVQGSEIGQLATSIGGGMPAGSCPVASFAMFGSSFTIDQHCQLLDDVSGLLSAIMRVVWVVMGILILLSA